MAAPGGGANAARPIARELLRRTALQPTSETAVGSVGLAPESSGWRRYLHGFTVVATATTGLLCLTMAFPEKDARGNDHVFSAPRRAFDRFLDGLVGPRRSGAGAARDALAQREEATRPRS